MRPSRQIKAAIALETTYSGEIGSYMPILFRDEPDPDYHSDMVERKVVRDFYGAFEQIPANGQMTLKCQTELWAAGTAGGTPAWDTMMKVCGYACTVTGGSRAEYTPINDNFPSARLKINDSGAEGIVRGVVGTAAISVAAGELVLADWEFRGVKVSKSAVDFGAPAGHAAWKKPQVIRDDNAGALWRGATYSAGAFSGGQAYNLRSMKIDLGNTIQYTEELTAGLRWGQEQNITDRQVTGEVVFADTAAQEVAIFDNIAAGEELSMSFAIGTAAGQKLAVHMRAAQLITPKRFVYQGRRYTKAGFRALPSETGAPEIILAVL
jgi:hypothetical protein